MAGSLLLLVTISLIREPVATARDIPWEYKGWQTFPTNWFGANPTGPLGGPGESNATLEIMARHHLVGWGWQQGMYDIPCSCSVAQQCGRDAATTFQNYTTKHHLSPTPTFTYRNMNAALLNFEDINHALNCSVNWTTYPALKQACGLSDPRVQNLRHEWFLHDRNGRICGSRSGTPSLQLTWRKSAPGALDYWRNYVTGGMSQHLGGESAIFLDVVDNGARWREMLNTSQGNCTPDAIDPKQWNKAMAMAEVEATITAVHTIAAALRPLGLAVIINAGTRLTEDSSTVLIPFDDFCERMESAHSFLDAVFQRLYLTYRSTGTPMLIILFAYSLCVLASIGYSRTQDERFDNIENILWYFEAWNSTLDLSTALFMKERKMPKIIHWFGANDTALPSQMAAFLIAQSDHDYFSTSFEWTDAGWGWHPLFASTRCGRALQNATSTRAGLAWRREFEHCVVELDLACDISTHDGCGTITPK